MTTPVTSASDSAPRPTTVPWRSSAVWSIALVAFATGFGAFGAVAALGDVAKAFGHHVGATTSISNQAGLSGSAIGIGLSILRLATLAGLFLVGLADRFGRRRTLLWCCAGGLMCTVLAAGSLSYWMFVAIFAAGRPMLAAASSVAHVTGSELTSTRDRATALAVITAGYGIGAGTIALIYTALIKTGGFRATFLIAAVPLIGLLWIRTRVIEPPRWTADHSTERAVLGHVDVAHRRRLLIVLVITFAVSAVSGPETSFVFYYAQNVAKVGQGLLATMVVASAVVGFLGLMAGRACADRYGRRPVIAVAATAMTAAAIVTYQGSRITLVIGYLAAIGAAGAIAPAGAAFANELFPTRDRGAVAGWNLAAGVLGAIIGLVCFGSLADHANSFAQAALITFIPFLFAQLLLLALPETAGIEPEELWGRV